MHLILLVFIPTLCSSLVFLFCTQGYLMSWICVQLQAAGVRWCPRDWRKFIGLKCRPEIKFCFVGLDQKWVEKRSSTLKSIICILRLEIASFYYLCNYFKVQVTVWVVHHAILTVCWTKAVLRNVSIAQKLNHNGGFWCQTCGDTLVSLSIMQF
jgi:hypothetical protein